MIFPQYDQPIYSVSEFNAEAKQIFDKIWQRPILITGEITNWRTSPAGHSYFSIKDKNCKIGCALFFRQQAKLNFIPENGNQVLIQARVSFYENDGQFQLIVLEMQLSGDGALQIAFSKLKMKLAQQGLFATEHKKQIPSFPNAIGIVTSPTGAAVRDILNITRQRFPAIPIIIYPSLVQGEQAATQLVQAIQKANQRRECDVLILARGGGSLEDLWAFNEEIVARAIFDSEIPIIAGIGHEIDFTIADLVADYRAPTPSAAAVKATPDRYQWQKYLNDHHKKLITLNKKLIELYQLQLTHLGKRLQHPHQKIQHQTQYIDHCEQKLISLLQKQILSSQNLISKLLHRLNEHHPRLRVQNYQQQIKSLQLQFISTMNNILHHHQNQIKYLSHNLNTVSPLQTLERGYSITMKTSDQTILRDTAQIDKNETISVKLAKGNILAVVASIE